MCKGFCTGFAFGNFHFYRSAVNDSIGNNILDIIIIEEDTAVISFFPQKGKRTVGLLCQAGVIKYAPSECIGIQQLQRVLVIIVYQEGVYFTIGASCTGAGNHNSLFPIDFF